MDSPKFVKNQPKAIISFHHWKVLLILFLKIQWYSKNVAITIRNTTITAAVFSEIIID